MTTLHDELAGVRHRAALPDYYHESEDAGPDDRRWLLDRLDTLTTAASKVIEGYEDMGLIHVVDYEALTDAVYELRGLVK